MLNKFSLSAPEEIFKKHYRGYAYLCCWIKGYAQSSLRSVTQPSTPNIQFSLTLCGWNSRQLIGPIRWPIKPSWYLMVLRFPPSRLYTLIIWLAEPLEKIITYLLPIIKQWASVFMACSHKSLTFKSDMWHVDSEMRLCRWGTRIVFVAGGKLKQGSQSVIGYPVWGNYPLYPPHPPSPALTPPPQKKVELSILILLAQSCLSFNMKPLTDVKSHC